MQIYINSNLKEAIKILNRHGAKTLVVINKNKKLVGTLSDGNIRKSILKGYTLESSINNIFHKKPIFFYDNELDYKKIKNIFLKKKIHLIPIVNKKKEIKKIIFLEDIINFDELNLNSKNNSSNLGVVIMAGGKGLRMQPYTKIFPKPLLPINDITVLDTIVSKFLNNNINNFYITTNYKHKMIFNHFKRYKSKINYKIIKEKISLGTAGSLSYLKNLKEDFFFVTNCDVVINEDYKKILKNHIKNKNDMTIVVSRKSIKLSYGVCLLNKKNKFSGIQEKPSYKFLFNVGLYLINRKEFKFIKKNQKLDMDKLIVKLKKNKKKIGIYETDYKNWKDFGNWENYINNEKS